MKEELTSSEKVIAVCQLSVELDTLATIEAMNVP